MFSKVSISYVNWRQVWNFRADILEGGGDFVLGSSQNKRFYELSELFSLFHIFSARKEVQPAIKETEEDLEIIDIKHL